MPILKFGETLLDPTRILAAHSAGIVTIQDGQTISMSDDDYKLLLDYFDEPETAAKHSE
jgi:uncharacterized protein (DUF1778 family)